MNFKVTTSFGNTYSINQKNNLNSKVITSFENHYSIKQQNPSSSKVTTSFENLYSIKQKSPSNFKVTTSYTYSIPSMPQKLVDLEDVNISGTNDKYILSYDATTQKWTNINPDDVLSAAVTDNVSPGLPSDFINQLDIDLDNKIDLDAGNF